MCTYACIMYPLQCTIMHYCFCLLSLMTRKLFALASGKCSPESADSPSNQEILLGGHFYLMALKVRLSQTVKKKGSDTPNGLAIS